MKNQTLIPCPSCGDFLEEDKAGYFCPACDSYFNSEEIDEYMDEDNEIILEWL